MFYAATIPGVTHRRATYPASRLLQRVLDEATRGQQNHAATVEQDDTATTLRFDVPGVSREQLSIGIEGNVVRIQSLPDAARQYKMAYQLAQDIAVESSSARLENGVLTVRLVRQTAPERVTKLAIH